MSRAMRNSGITWIGEIPSHWDTDNIGSLYSQRNEKVSDKDYPPLSVSKMGVVPQLETAAKTDDGDNRKLVKKGDFAINSRSDRRGSCGISAYDGSVSLINTILTPRTEMNPRFYDWLFHTSVFADEFYKWGHGIVDDLWTTRWAEMKRISIVVPPIPEQQAIADFLDKKCGEIDEMISLQERIVEELKAYKQSVITEAVCKGLNPYVPMKDSGIEWIGQIPEKWRIVEARRIVLSHLQGYYDADGYVSSGYRLLRITDLTGNGDIDLSAAPYVKETPQISDYLLKQGDFCFARTGGAGSFGYVSGSIEPSVFASYLIRFRFVGQHDNYLRYYFLSYSFISEICSLIHGGVNKNIHADNIKDTHIVLPPLAEQQAIADYLDKKCSEIDALISVKQSKIDALKEYKKSIIYEYITGKKEIPA